MAIQKSLGLGGLVAFLIFSSAFYQNCGGFHSQVGEENPKATAAGTQSGRPILISASFSTNDAQQNASYVLVTGSDLAQNLQFRFQPDSGAAILATVSSNSNTALTLRLPGATYDRIGRIFMENSSMDQPQTSKSFTIPKMAANQPTPTPTQAPQVSPTPTPTPGPRVSPTPTPTPAPECTPGQTQLTNGSGVSYGYACSRTGMTGQGQSAQCSCHDELKETCNANGFWGPPVSTGSRNCSWTGFCDFNPIQVSWSDPTMPDQCAQKCTLSDQVQKCVFNVTVKP